MNLLSILDGTPEPPIIDLHLDKINDSGDYHLPTPMYEFQKELTDQIVSLHYPDILKYCETNDSKELIIKSLEICIENCMLVSTHPYLLINHYMPKNLALKDIASKLADTSGKFNVLKDIANVIIPNDTSRNVKNVGVVMKNNTKFFDLTEALIHGCSGHKTIIRYVGNNLRKESKGKQSNNTTRFHLLPHDGDIQKQADILEQTKFDILIVFDSSVDTSSNYFRDLRTKNRRGEAIIIRLVPMRTIEHCQLYYSDQKDDESYLYKLISSIVCLRDQIGHLPPDLVPIYNQNLTYLSLTFFDSYFRSGIRGPRFPSWPLPDLPSIPRFSATDVERSLLTEVHFHYTPYDSADNVIDYVPASKKTSTKSYYETKRLELDYITNPLKNDLNKLTGISTLYDTVTSNDANKSILTHLLIMQLNNAYINQSIVVQEHQAYIDYNDSERQLKLGRREPEYKQTLFKIWSDADHTEQRINVFEKKIAKRNQEIEELKNENSALEGELNETAAKVSESQKLMVQNQLKIWETRAKIKDLVAKIKSKNEEKTYMASECANAEVSAKESQAQIEDANAANQDLKRRVAAAVEAEEEKSQAYKKQKSELMKKIQTSKEENEHLKKKLSKSLRFLRDTSHLKKRKGRAITPSNK